MTIARFVRPLAAALAVFLAAPSAMHAQSQAAGGTIEGRITDETNAAIPGAAVVIRNTATGATRETSTDESGLYRAPLLPVGPYEVTASVSGFATTRRTSLTLTIGQVLTADLTLKIASGQEELTVTADAPVLEVARTHQASTVGARAVANLPVNGRNFIDFALTTPGVTRDVRQGDISFAGQRGTLNSLVIDGADNNNTFFGQTLGRTGSGRAPYQFSQDAVQEFQVNRNAYSAEYGRAGGAVINVVTKSGTNEFHGSAFEFFRHEKLNANSYSNKTRNPIPDRARYRFDQFGGSLGGPIVKDKAFFFVSYDGQRNTIPNPVDFGVPVASLPTDAETLAGLARLEAKAADWERKQDQNVLIAKIDYQLAAAHRITLRYNHQNFTGQGFEFTGSTRAFEGSGDSLVRTRTLNGSLTSVLRPTFFNEFRVQYARDNEPGTANSTLPQADVRHNGQTVLVIGQNSFSPRETTIERMQVADTITWVRGRHTFKAGADVNRDEIKNLFPGNFAGVYLFNTVASFNRGIPNGSGERYTQAFAGPDTTGPETNPDITEYAAFVQDEWKVRRNLTLSMGLRYDLQSFAKPQVRNPDAQLAAAGIDTSFLATDKNNVAPRLGVAWNAGRDTVVRAGYGLFYGRTPSIMVGTAHSNNGINVQTITLSGAQVPATLVYPARLEAIPTGAAAARPTIFVFDRDYENPEVHQASAGIEHALRDDLAIGASFLHVAGRSLQRSRDFNVGTPVPTAIAVQGGGSVTIDQFPTTRPFSNFDRIIRFESTAESTYNGLTLEVRRPFRGRLQASLSYTLGKVEDTKPDATAVVPGSTTDDAKHASNPANFDADRAPGDNDQRHRVVFSGVWDMGYANEAGGITGALLGNWSLSWIASASSGQPYSRLIANDVNRDGNARNDIVPGGRNAERLPNAYVVDLRLARRIGIGGRAKLEIIGEAFNLLNSTNIFAQRSTFLSFTGGVLVPQANFGDDLPPPPGAGDPQRIVQLALKASF